MIITSKKDREKLLETLTDYDSFFLVGCSECATLCGTGGEPELAELKELLEQSGKKVSGTFRAKTGCQVLGTKTELKPMNVETGDAQAIIVMSCGAGTQAMVEAFPDKPVYPSNDSLFLGNMTRYQMFDERCSLCGECIIDQTGGICPVTACPKGLLNGPCGGTSNGNCEISPDIKCAWVRIYDRLEKINRLDDMSKIIKPKNWSKSQKPRVLSARPQKEVKEKK
ncbi:MAG: methylenetetrahydrofolate reductase C-terminal domain-containing protein [Nitrospirae bacterium]|nr:methylenetetrahydrofolate reductase C-terminal domain-containing protein [Nitrospirota bacterium]